MAALPLPTTTLKLAWKGGCWVQNSDPSAPPGVDEFKFQRAIPSAFMNRIRKYLVHLVSFRTQPKSHPPTIYPRGDRKTSQGCTLGACEETNWRSLLVLPFLPWPVAWKKWNLMGKLFCVYPHLALVQPSQEVVRWLFD